MHGTRLAVVGFGLLLAAALPANGEIVKGAMGIKGAEMSWWGGMARDAITRQYDVDKNLVTLFCEPGKQSYRPGVITFHAKKGRSIDLDRLHESLMATRLSGGTNMRVDYLEITVRGTVVANGAKGLVLRASGSDEEFVLAQAPAAKGELERLRETLSRGAKTVAIVSGQVPGWDGRFPDVLKALAKASKPRTLLVTGFETE